MSAPYAMPERIRLPLRKRIVPLAAVAVGGLLARFPPTVLRRALEFARGRARPATAAQASAARQAIIAVSVRCAVNGCLQRAIATALLCRARGRWPTWYLGARTAPFGEHAWVEAEGRMIDEPLPDGYYVPLITVPPRQPGTPEHRGTTGAAILRLHSNTASAETDDGAVLLQQRTGQYWQLNHTGVDSLQRLLSGQSVDEVAQDFAATYDIEPTQAREDITVMTDQLLSAGFLVRS